MINQIHTQMTEQAQTLEAIHKDLQEVLKMMEENNKKTQEFLDHMSKMKPIQILNPQRAQQAQGMNPQQKLAWDALGDF